MDLTELPTEILELICRLLVAKNRGRGRVVDITSTVSLKYTADPEEGPAQDQLERAFYNAELQVLRVCRRLYSISVEIVYGEHRFSCLQPASFTNYFSRQIGESMLAKISNLHLRVPRECRSPTDEASNQFVGFLTCKMPGLKILELSRRWYLDPDDTDEGVGQSMDGEERAILLWIGHQVTRKHRLLEQASWKETITRCYPEDGEDGPCWIKATMTLSSRSPVIGMLPSRSVPDVRDRKIEDSPSETTMLTQAERSVHYRQLQIGLGRHSTGSL